MATVIIEDSNGKRPVTGWIDIHSELAEEIVSLYNSREIYDKEYSVQYEPWETPGGE